MPPQDELDRPLLTLTCIGGAGGQSVACCSSGVCSVERSGPRAPAEVAERVYYTKGMGPDHFFRHKQAGGEGTAIVFDATKNVIWSGNCKLLCHPTKQHFPNN